MGGAGTPAAILVMARPPPVLLQLLALALALAALGPAAADPPGAPRNTVGPTPAPDGAGGGGQGTQPVGVGAGADDFVKLLNAPEQQQNLEELYAAGVTAEERANKMNERQRLNQEAVSALGEGEGEAGAGEEAHRPGIEKMKLIADHELKNPKYLYDPENIKQHPYLLIRENAFAHEHESTPDARASTVMHTVEAA